MHEFSNHKNFIEKMGMREAEKKDDKEKKSSFTYTYNID
jgi:hypothetical protein